MDGPTMKETLKFISLFHLNNELIPSLIIILHFCIEIKH